MFAAPVERGYARVSSTHMYHNSKHTSNCPDIDFPSFFKFLFSKTQYLATLPKPFLVLPSLESKTDRQTEKLTNLEFMLHTAVESLHYADSVGVRGFTTVLSSEFGALVCLK